MFTKSSFIALKNIPGDFSIISFNGQKNIFLFYWVNFQEIVTDPFIVFWF